MNNVSFDIPLPKLDNNIGSSEFIVDNPTDFKLNNLTSLHDDIFEKRSKNCTIISVGNYEISNFYPKDCGQTKARDIQLSQPNVNFIGGKGWIGSDGCLIDTDTDLRFKESTNKRYINQLQERLVKTSPYIRGILNVDIESSLLPGDKTDSRKAVGDFAGVSIYDRQVTPLIHKLQQEVQDPNHIIQENADKEWIHGGVPTRQIMRNIDYLKRCNNQK